MAVLTRSLGDRENWQIGHSIEAKRLTWRVRATQTQFGERLLGSGPWTSGKGNPRRPVVGHVPEHS